MTQQPQNPWGPAPAQQQPQGQPWAQQGPPQGQMQAYPGAAPWGQGAPAGPAAPVEFLTPGAPGGSGDGPALSQLVGRLLIVKVHTVQEATAAQQYGTATFTCDVMVLDGPPVPGRVDAQTNNLVPFATGPMSAPFVLIGTYMSGKVLDNNLRPHVGKGPVVGRFGVGVQRGGNRPPWKLDAPTEQDLALAGQLYPRWAELAQAASITAEPVQYQQVQPQGQPGQWAAQPVHQQPANPWGQQPAAQPYQQPQQGQYPPY